MGNFMIGSFYPPFLGRIEKIMCGAEQCWPRNTRDRKWFFLMDNPVDRNVLAVNDVYANLWEPWHYWLFYDTHDWLYSETSGVRTSVGWDYTSSFWKCNADGSRVYLGTFTHHIISSPEEVWWDDPSPVYLYVNPLKEFNFKANITYKNRYGSILKHENVYHINENGTMRDADNFIQRNWSSYKPDIGGLPAGFFTSSGYTIIDGSVSEQWPGNMGNTWMDSNYELYPDLSVCDEDTVKANVSWTVTEGSIKELPTELYATNEYKPLDLLSNRSLDAAEITSEGIFTLWEDFRYGDVGKYVVERVGDYYRVLFYGYNSNTRECDIYLGERRCTYVADSDKQVWYDDVKILHYLKEVITPEPPSPADTKVRLYIQDSNNGWKIVDTYEITAESLWASLPMGHTTNPYMYYYEGKLMLEGDFTRYIDEVGRETIDAQFYTYDYSLPSVVKNPSYALSIRNETGTPYWLSNHSMYAQI